MQCLYLNTRGHHSTLLHSQWFVNHLWHPHTWITLLLYDYFYTAYEELYLCRKVVTELEFLEEGRHDDGGEEENDTPEEDIRNVRPFGATGAAHKLPALLNTILQHQVEGNQSIYTERVISNKAAWADSRFARAQNLKIFLLLQWFAWVIQYNPGHMPLISSVRLPPSGRACHFKVEKLHVSVSGWLWTISAAALDRKPLDFQLRQICFYVFALLCFETLSVWAIPWPPGLPSRSQRQWH